MDNYECLPMLQLVKQFIKGKKIKAKRIREKIDESVTESSFLCCVPGA